MDDLQMQEGPIADAGIGIVRLVGSLDMAAASRAQQQIRSALQEHEYRVVVDLQHVDLLDSAGIGVLVAGLKLARERGGELGLAGPNARVHGVFRLTGLERLFPIYGNESEAFLAMSRR